MWGDLKDLFKISYGLHHCQTDAKNTCTKVLGCNISKVLDYLTWKTHRKVHNHPHKDYLYQLLYINRQIDKFLLYVSLKVNI